MQPLNLKKMSEAQQAEILKTLYYSSREAEIPMALGVLHRKLNEGKSFDDFFKVWMPPAEYTQPFSVDGTTYYNFFGTPLRVINAVNMQKPEEIISVGIIWCKESELDGLVKKAFSDKANDIRHDAIEAVAEKMGNILYKVKSDIRLGN